MVVPSNPAAPRGEDAAGELADLLAAARAAWPHVEVAPERFVGYLRERVPDGGRIADLRVADLYLACACADGDQRAIAAFAARFIAPLSSPLGRLRLDEPLLDELRQRLLRKLFVPEPGRRASIADYAGRGGLDGWVRVAALRVALNLLSARGERDPHTHPLSEDDRLLDASTVDPELSYLKGIYRAAFKSAFREALSSLSPRAQNLLRQHFIDGLTKIQLGVVWRVHRTTMARWLEEAEQELLDLTRATFMRQARIGRADCDSIFALVRSQLDVTLQTLLR